LERALRVFVGRERVKTREAGKARGPLVDLRIELHRARPERVKLRVDAIVPLREANEVTERFGLAHLGEGCGRFSGEGTERRARGGTRRGGRARRARRWGARETGSPSLLGLPWCGRYFQSLLGPVGSATPPMLFKSGETWRCFTQSHLLPASSPLRPHSPSSVSSTLSPGGRL